MKKISIFLLFITLFGCNSIIKNNQSSNNFNCPRVFFSTEDKIFLDTTNDISSFDNITLKAELNNYALTEKCYLQNDIAFIPLEILIIVQPMQKLTNPDILFPLYITLLNDKDEVLETQYFMISGSIKKNLQTKVFLETDIKNMIQVITENLNTAQIVLGFMLDDKKRLLLN